LFIDLLALSDSPGEITFYGYLLDMSELFERFVIAMFRKAGEIVPLVAVKDHQSYALDLGNKIGINPDLTLEGPNRSMVAVDAKYKRTIGDGKAKHPDLYQIIAYCTALGLVSQQETPVQGILVYPVSESSYELADTLRVITTKKPSSELSIRTVWLDLHAEDVVGDIWQVFTNFVARDIGYRNGLRRK
jgi:5-methylcytosine-specific restriction endonuclease McrBC regulatory subunit McrC